MQKINLDKEWEFRRGMLDFVGYLDTNPAVTVNLPHDGMIETDVSADAPAKSDMGYFSGDLTNYVKFVDIPKEWEKDSVGLYFDGVMMNATVDINGYKAASCHYGYAPFYVDLTDYVTYGEKNRITINTDTSSDFISRWYTGSGIYRSVELCHGPKVHIANNGIFVYTKEVTENEAFLEAQIDVENRTSKNRLVEVILQIKKDGCDEILKTTKRIIQVNAMSKETAYLAFSVENPELWDAENPKLYEACAYAVNKGEFRTHFIPDGNETTDEASTIFGIRTISVDVKRGLRINGKTVKLKGGCLHHDNGLIGTVSFYEIEARKIRKLKEVGFNAIRTSHNPPSCALIEACDRLGMYVFDEAFDAWGMAKRSGDYSRYFDECWEKDLDAFIRRDRTHPSVIIWSTGNEIPERGGLNNGYSLATRLADAIHRTDGTRPVSNGICSMWCGLDDMLIKDRDQSQNAAEKADSDLWERVTEPFTNGLDIVGYNYYEDGYEKDHVMFPDRVMMGSENFPKEIGFRWPMVEKLPYVLGDFTWTAWDYLGEAGIGKAVYVDKDDPLVEEGPWAVMPYNTSFYPWRTANDADFDITGHIMPQGQYRSVVWGNNDTFLYSKHPDNFGKVEICSMWGFPAVLKNWTYEGYENKPIELTVFSRADEVEVFINGKTIGRKTVSKDRPLPNSVSFETVYQPGTVEAVSYTDGKEISRDMLITAKKPSKIRLVPEKNNMKADGHDILYVGIEILDEDDVVAFDKPIKIKASVDGEAVLSGLGSSNPVTDENYTDDETITYHGRAQAVLRSGYNCGNAVLTVTAEGIGKAELTCDLV